MDALELLRIQTKGCYEWLEMTLSDVTDEQAKWQPPGLANSIGLDRPVDMSMHGLGMWKGLDIYNLHGIDHPRLHGGEIACLKGLQGVPGWRTGWRGDRSVDTGE